MLRPTLPVFLKGLMTSLFAIRAAHASLSQTVSVRIEGPTTTIYEADITSGPCNISVTGDNQPGGFPQKFICNGIGAGAHTNPGDTPTCALSAVAKAKGFTIDGSFDGEFNDFFISRIDGIESFPNNVDMFWGLLWNYQIPKFGEGLTLSGCQQEIVKGDRVLWAYAAHDTKGIHYLNVSPRTASVKKGGSASFKVYDGLSGVIVPGAALGGVTSDSKGMVTLKFPTSGTFVYKATRSGDVRSGQVVVTVT